MNNIYIIAELCGQWGGSVARAKKMIDQCAQNGADAVKVQLYDTYRMPGKNREKWEYLTMSKDQFLELNDYANQFKIDFFASPFHADRFEWILEAKLKVNKIASSLLEWDFALCEKMINSNIKTFCSLGKWDKDEMPFDNDNVHYLHCVAKYPHDTEEAIELMPREFSNQLTGYSDHSIGIEACEEAIKRGATVIEKHFTLDHSQQSQTEGAHLCSMNYAELNKLRGK